MGFGCEKRRSLVATTVARGCGVALLLFLFVAAGSDEPFTVNVSGTLQETHGQVRAGMRVGPGVLGTVTAIPSTGPRITVVVGPSGSFRMKLAPGTYHFVGHRPAYPAGIDGCGAYDSVKVARRAVSGVIVDCAGR